MPGQARRTGLVPAALIGVTEMAPHTVKTSVSGPIPHLADERFMLSSPQSRALKGQAVWVPSILVVAGSLVLRLPGLVHQLFDPDEAAIATMGMVVSRGGVLYRDVIDRKPPLAPFLYAASFIITGSRDLRPLHLFAALEIAAAALLLAWEVRRRVSVRAGWWAAGLLLAAAIAFRPTDSQAANFSHLALLPGCAAIVLARRGTRRSAVGAGVCLGLAVLTRQTWIIGLAPAVVAVWLHGGRRASRGVIVTATTLATVASIGLVVPLSGFVHWTFTGNGSLLFDVSPTAKLTDRALLAIAGFVLAHAAVCWLVIRRGWHRGDLDLWLWLTAGLIAVAAGLRFFEHYWMQALPPLCLLAAPAIERFTRNGRRVMVAFVAVPTAFAWWAAWSPAHRANPAPLVAEVREDTRPNQTVAVWGSFPEIYWRSGRDPGGALVLSDFVVGKAYGRPNGAGTLRDATPGALDQYLEALRAHPPELFLDTSTGDIRGYGRYPPSLLPGLESFLDAHYKPTESVDGVAIYRLKT